MEERDICILTPTYIDHLKYIKRYLQSARRYIKNSANFAFVIEKESYLELSKIIQPFKRYFNIKILIFEDLLTAENIIERLDILQHCYNKYCYQTLKKYYAMLALPYKYFLILDSESEWISTCNITDLFEEYFKAPFITGSVIQYKMLGDIKKNVCICTDYLLNFKSDKWFLENFCWFYDRSILTDLISELGTPLKIVENAKAASLKRAFEPYVFEICLYQNYIYKNNNKYNYRILDVSQLCKKYMSPQNINGYMKKYESIYRGEGGVLEFTLNLLSKENVQELATLFSENHICIIRCENSMSPLKVQKTFLEIVHPYILAASQSHVWGINHDFFSKFKYYYYPIIKKMIKKVISYRIHF